MWNDPEFRKLYEEVTGLKNAVYGGFQDMRRDMATFRQLYVPIIVWVAVVTVLALAALGLSLDNRAVLKRQLTDLQQGVNAIQQEDATPKR